jgi:hypothetical protein
VIAEAAQDLDVEGRGLLGELAVGEEASVVGARRARRDQVTAAERGGGAVDVGDLGGEGRGSGGRGRGRGPGSGAQ